MQDGFIKVSAGTPDIRVADCEYNKNEITTLIDRANAQGVRVLVLPELLGIDGVWLAVTAAELASLAVSFAMFRQKDRIFHYRSE